eukprot:3985705-Prorocentrum_lima.AAC.1
MPCGGTTYLRRRPEKGSSTRICVGSGPVWTEALSAPLADRLPCTSVLVKAAPAELPVYSKMELCRLVGDETFWNVEAGPQ